MKAGTIVWKSMLKPWQGRAIILFVVFLSFFCFVDSGFSQSVDSFNPQVGGGYVDSMAVQPDGRIVIGGSFTEVEGQKRFSMARLNSDGSMDEQFKADADGSVTVVAMQEDGKILLGGYFGTVSGVARSRIARLNADGSLDDDFNPGSDGVVYCYAMQRDGKILVGGDFTQICGHKCMGIARLNADGSLDSMFAPWVSGGAVNCLAVQQDGKVLLAGSFTSVGSEKGWVTRSYCVRLNADGSLDDSFAPEIDGTAYSIAIQKDGRILVGGSFNKIGNQGCQNIGRVNSDGTVDSSFKAVIGAESYHHVACLSVQADGDVIVGGWFSIVSGERRNNIARLHEDGSLDYGLDPGTDGETYPCVTCLGVQPDGQILVGGNFSTLGGLERFAIGRVSDSHQIDNSLNFDDTTIAWMRNGAAPEFSWVAADVFIPSIGWTNLGPGIRIAGGWKWTGAHFPAESTVRAFGAVVGSAWFVESSVGPVTVERQPASGTNRAGDVRAFEIRVAGSQPISYQWLKDGVSLTNDAFVSGAQTESLGLSNLLHRDAGEYSVIVSNAFGSVTSQLARLTVVDPIIVTQPVSTVCAPGDVAVFTVVASGTTPLNYQWRREGIGLLGMTNTSLVLSNVQSDARAVYDVVISNQYGMTTSSVVRLSFAVSPDSFNPGADSYVECLALQTDGKIIIGGDFSLVGGQTRKYVARINQDGTLDAAFNPTVNRAVYCEAIQQDEKILLGGSFTNVCGERRNFIARINADGTLDREFNPAANSYVYCISPLKNGKILVGGYFTTLSGESHNYIGRLNADGTLDKGFSPYADGVVSSIAVQADGKFLVAGVFRMVGGQPRNGLARLNPDGTLDFDFQAGLADGSNGGIFSLSVQPDGKILIGGNFRTLCGEPCAGIGRLNADGSLDKGFKADGNIVLSMALQANGMILVGGDFSYWDGQMRGSVVRLNSNGSLDNAFDPQVQGSAFCIGVQNDGKVLIGGALQSVSGQSRRFIGRLNQTDPVTDVVNLHDSVLSWYRGGALSQLDWATADVFLPASGWSDIGAGIRNAEGWRWNVPSSYTNATLRARGAVANQSTWFEEMVFGPTVITEQPVSRTNNADTFANFSVKVTGETPINYRWRRDGVDLIDAPNIGGAQTACLTVQHVLGGDAGAYSVVISNSFGVITSLVAELTVVDPLITAQPTNVVCSPGSNATFAVVVMGTGPFVYQWRRNGTDLAGMTAPSLALTNVQSMDRAGYDVVISNRFGCITSAVARLSYPVTVDSLNAAAGNPIRSIALEQDGKILVGGWIDGLLNPGISRLNPDGSLDKEFDPGTGGSVYSFAVQPDGKILLGGYFSKLGGVLRNGLGRLNVDGSVDTSFNPNADATVYALAVQKDGKIIVAGGFSTIAGGKHRGMVRLNPDGSVDASFNPSIATFVDCIALQPDGKILFAGSFSFQGVTYGIGRLNPNGELDTGFVPGVTGSVWCMALQADGKILMDGGGTSNPLRRLNSDGTLDSGFISKVSGQLYSLAVQADGKVLVGGSFTMHVGQQMRNNLIRLNSDGTLDAGFDPRVNGPIYSVALQSDGKLMVGGAFNNLAGQKRIYIGRLNETDPAVGELKCDGQCISWLRAGTAPEIWNAMADLFVPGTGWTPLGSGTRVQDGWKWGANVPSNATLRVRGAIAGGYYNNSSWFVEEWAGPTAIVTDPTSRTNLADTTTVFEVSVAGSPPMTYQWRKNDVNLADSLLVSGAQKASLTLSHLLGKDAGAYSVIVSNGSGVLTSRVATLSVVDPIIVTQPSCSTGYVGQSTYLNVGIRGSGPMYYQWFREGINILGETNSQLVFNPVKLNDAGGYSVVGSNMFGRVASSNIQLIVFSAPYLTAQPSGQTNRVGATASFEVVAGGTGPMSYCWLKNGAALSNGERVAGANDAKLTLLGLQTNDSGCYSVIVSNRLGSVTSSNALLLVTPMSQPRIMRDRGDFGVRSERFGFSVTADSGQMIIIDSSSDLKSWNAVETNVFDGTPHYFSDPLSTNDARRFYRLRVR